jgi:hypothetical protein
MGRYASDSGGGDFKPAPEGTHLARCVELIDIGTHESEYQGKKVRRNQVIVRWELPHVLHDDGKPMLVSKFYTNSLSEKATLLADLTAWRGRKFTVQELNKFDLQTILGKPCQVTVVHNDNNKAKVTAVSGIPAGVTVPEAFNKPRAFWIEEWDGNDTAPPFSELPKGFQDLIKSSEEYKTAFVFPVGNEVAATKTVSRDPNVDTFDDDIPF